MNWKAEINKWPEWKREEWEERAAILEFDAGMSLESAELNAYLIVRDRNRDT